MPRAKNFADRGISSLSTTEADFEALFERRGPAGATAVQDIAVERIRPNPFQARTTFDGIEELADAIRAQGFVTRLRVRPDPTQDGIFQLVFGERRLLAARQIGLATVPCEIAPHSDAEMIEIGLAENIQRRDLEPLEEARAFTTLIDQRGYTHERLAERIGKDRSYVESRLALLRAPEDVQQMVVQRPDSLRAAREIAKVPDATARRPLIDGVISGGLSTGAVRTLVQESVSGPAERVPPDPSPSTEEPRPVAADLRRSAFSRALDRDIPTLRGIFARWRQAVKGITPDDRARVLAYIDEHIAEMERLADSLR